MSLVSRPEYVKEIFERQCEIGLANLAEDPRCGRRRHQRRVRHWHRLRTQSGPIISPKTYRSLFQPVHARSTTGSTPTRRWKTFIHSCGSIWRLLDDIVDAGFDVLNPVQTSAADMDPQGLKDRYGDRITFWGGGIDTQRVLPFGSPADVRAMVRGADPDLRRRWRIRLQHHSQPPGPRPGRQHYRLVRGGQRVPRLPLCAARGLFRSREVTEMGQLEELRAAIVDGENKAALAKVTEALASGLAPEQILQDGLIAAMGETGALYQAGEIFVPEMLVAAHAMSWPSRC